MKIKGVLLVVSEVETALFFFCTILGFQERWRTDHPGDLFQQLYKLSNQKICLAALRLGKEWVYLVQLSAPHIKHYPLSIEGNDLAFQHIAIVVSNMERAYAEIKEQNIISISPLPQTIPQWNKAAAGIEAFYFRSPNGYLLELIYFPPGKGDPRWQKDTTRLFQGIDHTAITITDTEASLRFYRDLLHFIPVGGSLNYGETQEKLSGVSGAKVQITALHSPRKEGIGLEFLHYLNPDPLPSSLGGEYENMYLIVEVENFSDQKRQLYAANISISAEGQMHLEDGMHQSYAINDPDGHRLLIVDQVKNPEA